MRVALAVLAAAAVGIAACSALPGGSPGAGSPAPTADVSAPPHLTIPPDITIPPDVSVPPEMGSVPPELLAQAAQEAAAAANVSLDEVVVSRAEAVTWPSPALGCPDPGQMYAQVLTPGYWLVLEAGDQQFDFRASQRGAIKLCPQGQGEPPIEDQ